MQQEHSPFYTLFFLVSVLAILGAIAFVFPENGIKINENFKIKFPTIQSLFFDKKPRYAAIPPVALKADSISLILLNNLEKKTDTLTDEKTKEQIAASSSNKKTEKTKQTRLHKKSDITSQKIEFPENNPSVLYPFFEKLETAADAENSLRIIHFGDSQIEGDRISGFIRERLQSRFGGGGPGLVPALKLYNQGSVSHANTGNWTRHTLIGKTDKNVAHNRYGVMCAFSKFTPLTFDSSAVVTSATVRFNTATSIYPGARKFKRIKIYYGNNGNQVSVEILTNKRHYLTDTLNGTALLNVKTIEFDIATDNAELIFNAANCPDIYGISLDMPDGIAVDNIALRGSSGTIFTKTDKQLLSLMLKDLNTALIIMQFGGNVMPYIKDEKSCIEYGNFFYMQLMTLKNLIPDAAIIVIGPADMSKKENDYYITYPLLESVRNALKNAAFKAGAGFWDMYAAMGGKNSMPSWVAATPPLAVSDYVHFTPKGARIIAELFYEALNHEYENYRYIKAEAKHE
jgi:lysophospholipase L1-like esterase